MIPPKPNQKGFTLLELIAVMILLGILASLAIPRYIDLDRNARQRAIDAGISELNGRESLVWSNIKMSPSGWQNDAQTFAEVDKFLGDQYVWSAGPDASGGTIILGRGGEAVPLTREKSEDFHPGHWSR
jgi:prepilin-type N-terminal cleavage/methylation domain-containing protein